MVSFPAAPDEARTLEVLARIKRGDDDAWDVIQLTGIDTWTALASGAYMLAENSSFLDFLRYWRKWILEGRFGHISIAEAEYLHYLPATVETPDRQRIPPSQARAEGIAESAEEFADNIGLELSSRFPNTSSERAISVTASWEVFSTETENVTVAPGSDTSACDA